MNKPMKCLVAIFCLLIVSAFVVSIPVAAATTKSNHGTKRAISWRREFKQPTTLCSYGSIDQALDGGYLAAFSTDFKNGKIVRMSKNGKILWSRSFKTNFKLDATECDAWGISTRFIGNVAYIELYSDNTQILTYKYRNSGMRFRKNVLKDLCNSMNKVGLFYCWESSEKGQYDYYAEMLDSHGKVEWKKRFKSDYVAREALKNGKILFAGDGYIIQMNVSGEEEIKKPFDERPLQIVQTLNGDIYVLSTSVTEGKNGYGLIDNLTITKYKNDFALQWRDKNAFKEESVIEATATDDGGIFILAKHYQRGDGRGFVEESKSVEMLALKYDASGNKMAEKEIIQDDICGIDPITEIDSCDPLMLKKTGKNLYAFARGSDDPEAAMKLFWINGDGEIIKSSIVPKTGKDKDLEILEIKKTVDNGFIMIGVADNKVIIKKLNSNGK